MKTRSDFVSNSSSCSFVISSDVGDLAAAVKFFAEAFKDCDMPYQVDDRIEISAKTKNKWLNQMRRRLKGEDFKPEYDDWRIKYAGEDPEAVGWDSVYLSLDQLRSLASDEWALPKVESIRFACGNHDYFGELFLRLMYFFFDRNRFSPDASETEHDFLHLGDSDDFTTRLASACRPEADGQDGELRRK